MTDIKEKTWVCRICGHVHSGGKPPNVCPLCGAEADKFVEVEI